LSDEILAKHGPQGLICSGLFDLEAGVPGEGRSPGIRTRPAPLCCQSISEATNSLSLLWSGVINFIARNPQYRMTFGSVGISQGDEYTPASRTLIVNFTREQFSHRRWPRDAEARSPFEGHRAQRPETGRD